MAERWQRARRLVGPFGSRQRSHPAQDAFGGPPDQPDAAIALDPVSNAVTDRPDRLALRRWKAFRLSRRAGDALRIERADAAIRSARAADGCTEVHHRLREIAR